MAFADRSRFLVGVVLGIASLIVSPVCVQALPSQNAITIPRNLKCAHFRDGLQAGQINKNLDFATYSGTLEDLGEQINKLDRKSQKSGLSRKDKSLILRERNNLIISLKKFKSLKSKEQELCDSLTKPNNEIEAMMTQVCHFAASVKKSFICGAFAW